MGQYKHLYSKSLIFVTPSNIQGVARVGIFFSDVERSTDE
jgi:hypothetical protein